MNSKHYFFVQFSISCILLSSFLFSWGFLHAKNQINSSFVASEITKNQINSSFAASEITKSQINSSFVASEITEKRKFTYRLGKIWPNLVKMEKDGVISSARVAFFSIKVLFLAKKIKKGIYTFEESAGMLNVLTRLVRGDEDVYALTIYEGNDLYDIDQMLLSARIIRQPYAFVDHVNKPSMKKLIMKKAGIVQLSSKNNLRSVEGFFYPDTYKVRASRALRELIDLSVGQFRQKVTNLFVEKKIAKEDWLKYLTIASLIEKETALEREKKLVSSVIFNRLRKNKKLEFCSSLIYMLKDLRIYYSPLRDGTVDIKTRHYPIASDYNTYYKKGLPPSPITTPTFSSVEAALFPASTPYFYFVVRDQNKRELGHHFSVTYREHLEKIKKILKK